MNHRKSYLHLGIIVMIGGVLFLPFLGEVHLFDWDEINFAEAAREMIVTGNYWQVQIDYQPFWEKPPLFIWLQALSMHLWGITEYAARFPNALFGVITLPILYLIGKQLYHPKMGVFWCLAYTGSFLPHFYFKSGIIDPVFNFFMFTGVYFLFRYYAHGLRWKNIILAGLLVGLAVLTKGPVGYLIPALCWGVFWIFHRQQFSFPLKPGLAFTGLVIIMSFGWYGYDIWTNGWGFFEKFINYQVRLLTTADAGHQGQWYYHFVVLLIGCFPASVFAIPAFHPKFALSNDRQQLFHYWMGTVFWVILILFTLVQTKIIHYSSLAYYPLTFLAATYIYHQKEKQIRLPLLIGTATIGGLFAFALLLLPIIGQHPDYLLPYIKDPFAKGNLQANVSWTGYEAMLGLFYLLIIGISGWWMRRSSLQKGAITLFAGTLLTLWIMLPLIVPKIEQYTQGAPVQFYQTLQEKDVYVEVIGFKSYAHLFYTRKQPQNAPDKVNKSDNMNYQKWLLHGEVDKPAYFVCKNINADQYRKMPQLNVIKEKNGFVFFKRTPP